MLQRILYHDCSNVILKQYVNQLELVFRDISMKLSIRYEVIYMSHTIRLITILVFAKMKWFRKHDIKDKLKIIGSNCIEMLKASAVCWFQAAPGSYSCLETKYGWDIF